MKISGILFVFSAPCILPLTIVSALPFFFFECNIHQANLTGESKPVSKNAKRHDLVYAGTINCGGGYLEIVCHKVSRDSAVAKMVALVEQVIWMYFNVDICNCVFVFVFVVGITSIVCSCIFTCMCIYTRMYICIYKYICIYIYIYTYMYTYIYKDLYV